MKVRWSQDLFQRAFKFASQAHYGQKIPGSELPYIIHVSLVCTELMAVINENVDADLIVQCASLHDVLEDTPVTFEIIKNEFGQQIADGVAALTKNRHLKKEFQGEESLQRILKQPIEIWMVKMADRITNLGPPPASWTRDKRLFYRKQSIQVYETLKDADKILGDRLKAKIESYQEYI